MTVCRYKLYILCIFNNNKRTKIYQSEGGREGGKEMSHERGLRERPEKSLEGGKRKEKGK